MKSKIWIKLAAIGAFIITILVLLKEVLKGRVDSTNLEEFKKGLQEEKKKNNQVIKESVENIKLQNKLIEEKTKAIHDMTMNEQLLEAKKLGLVK